MGGQCKARISNGHGGGRMLAHRMKFLEDDSVCVILVMAIVLFLSAIAGFWIQGLTKNIWDLNAMWSGIGAIFSAAATKFGKCWLTGKAVIPVNKIPEHSK